MNRVFTIIIWLVAVNMATADDFDERCREVAENYAKLVHTSYADSLVAAQRLLAEVKHFTNAPDAEKLAAAKSAWIAARKPYLQTEVFRFSGGPIDDADGPEPMINGWPVDEFYIDYVEGAPKAGIVNDLASFPEITGELIRSHNEKGGETVITCGFHAIEFLMWGQDLDDAGPGARPVADFITAPNAGRRCSYLKICAELLVEDLQGLVDDWKPGDPKNYRASFLADNPRRSIWLIILGMKTFSGVELAGERLLVAWDTRAQEDEHSCFSDTTSDTTNQDVIFDATGLKNVFADTGLRTLIETLDSDAAADLAEAIDGAIDAAKSIPAPFDQAMLGPDDAPGRVAILSCVEHLEHQSAIFGKIEQLLLPTFKR